MGENDERAWERQRREGISCPAVGGHWSGGGKNVYGGKSSHLVVMEVNIRLNE